jgi:flagellar motility protein MotE (MotC chaperone)
MTPRALLKFIQELRLIPIAVLACACLLALKALDLALGGSALIAGDNAPRIDTGRSIIRATGDVPQPSSSMLSWASQMFNFPDGSGATAAPTRIAAPSPADRGSLDITGSVTEPAKKSEAPAKADAAKADAAKPDAAKPAPDAKPPGTVIPLDNPGQPSGAERAILERLAQRRQELDTRARELDIRESLIKAAEKRIEGQLAELKETEGRIKVETEKKNEALAARFNGLVTMYENMKPRDAAKIFDRLDGGVLFDVASKIEPRHMADILAQMSPDAAQHLTVELASAAQQVKPAETPAQLPKIEGRPTQ